MTQLYFEFTKRNLVIFFSEKRTAYLSIFLKFINSLGPLLVWLSFFQIQSAISTFTLESATIIMSLACLNIGINNCFFDGIFHLPYLSQKGKIDEILLQPRNVIDSIISQNQSWDGIGAILAGLTYLLISHLSLLQNIYALLLLIFVVIYYFSFMLVLNSLPLLTPTMKNIPIYIDSMITAYTQFPEKLFPTHFRFLFYTIIPSGLISYLPAQIIKDQNYLHLLLFGFLSLSCLLISIHIFQFVIKKYVEQK